MDGEANDVPTEPKTPWWQHITAAVRAAIAWVKALLAATPTVLETLVVGAVAGLAFATSADNALTVGRLVHIHNWHSWVVAGTGEVLASFSFLEFRRRAGLARVLPLAFFAVAVSFIILANLASAGPSSWAYKLLPWDDIYRAAAPVVFVILMVLIETRNRSFKKAKKPSGAVKPQPTKQQGPKPPTSAASGPHLVTELGKLPTKRKHESLQQALARWETEGFGYNDRVRAGVQHYGKSDTTVKREMRNAKKAAS